MGSPVGVFQVEAMEEGRAPWGRDKPTLGLQPHSGQHSGQDMWREEPGLECFIRFHSASPTPSLSSAPCKSHTEFFFNFSRLK